MKCPKCDYECPPDFDFCPRCSTAVHVSCPRCGFRARADFAFCPMCTTPLTDAAEEPAGPAVDESIEHLVPEAFAERLLATRGEGEPERRRVTILFCDVMASVAMADRLDPADVREITDGARDILIESVYRHEGTLGRLRGDAVLGFFGAPIAHEDDPERACRAALEIVEGARAYAETVEEERGIEGCTVRVGINVGPVVVGDVGPDLRVEYQATGDAVDLAARLEESAPPGGILITHGAYRYVRGVFDVLQQEPLTLKGIQEPVQSYLLQRAKPRPFPRVIREVEGLETRTIGRQAELTRLQEAFFTAVEDGELQMVTVAGDAGVGKSRLLREFENWAELAPQPYCFFKGRALPETQGLPNALIRSLVAFRFQIQDTDPMEAVRGKLEQGIAVALGDVEDSRQARRAAHLIGHLVGFELGESPHLEGIEDEPRKTRDRALTYLADYFRALSAESPVLVLLDDLHLADSSSLDALNHLVLALKDHPLMIAGATRPSLFERRPHWGEGQAFHRWLELAPLTNRDTRQLLREILQRMEQVPQALTELVVTSTEGNPFFIEELVKLLVEAGAIVKGEKRWQARPARLSDMRVPPSVRHVLEARLGRLPAEDRTVLQQASAIGRLFWDRALASMNEEIDDGIDEDEMLAALSELRRREMVFRRPTTAVAGAEEVVFKHAILREVAYRSLPKELRAAFHGLVADWLVEQTGDRAVEVSGLIADHLELAGRAEEAVANLLEAGDRARRRYAHQQAIVAYERALALLQELGDEGRTAQTLMKLGLAYHTAHDFERSRVAYDEGFSLWRPIGIVSPAPPAAEPSGKPSIEPPPDQPDESPVSKPVEEPIEEPDEPPVEKSAEPSAEPPAEQPEEQPAVQPAEPKAEEPAAPAEEEPDEEPEAQAPLAPQEEQPAEPKAEQPTERSAEEPEEELAEPPAEQPPEQPPTTETLRVSGWDASSLDPARRSAADGASVVEQLFSGLVALTPQLEIVPSLADAWEISEKGRRYVFHLADDLRWSDGEPVTAGDVEYAWKRVLDPDAASPKGQLLYAVKGAQAVHSGQTSDLDRVGVRAVDETTVVVELEEPAGYFLHLLANASTFPVPKHVVEAHGNAWTKADNIVTSGPFTLESWERDEALILARNPHYRGDTSGNVQTIDLSTVDDPPERLELYESDAVDLLKLSHTAASQIEWVRQRFPREHHALPARSTQYVGFGTTRRPFDDARLRRAFALAIDSQELAADEMLGHPAPATGGFVPPGLPGHTAGIGFEFDPGRARELLMHAGFTGGRDFPRVEAVLGSDSAYLGEQLRAQWKATLGIDIAWESVPSERLCDRLDGGEPPDLFISGWTADYPDPDSFLGAGHVRAHSRWRDEAYDQLLEQARAGTDQRQRMKRYRQADQMLVDQVIVVPLYYPRPHVLVKPWVKKFPGPWKDVIVEPH